jgi:excisionase family DNA binding protein
MQNQSLKPLALRAPEAAKMLSISAGYLWRLTREGHIPCVRVGSGKRKTILYPVAELQAWLQRQTEASVPDPSSLETQR